MPLFSVVVPTRNRPSLLIDTLKSVLFQDFDDFELIVSNNSTDTETARALEHMAGRGRLTVIRPPVEQNMIDHWEFATGRATGEYVVVLTDRIVLKQHALKRMAAATRQFPHLNCFANGTQSYLEDLGKLGTRVRNGPTKIWRSSDLIRNLLTTNFYSSAGLDYCFPKTINGWYRNRFAMDVRRQFGSYFNTVGTISPDYASFFINCALNQECLFLGEILHLGQGSKLSTGAAVATGNFDYLRTLGRADVYERVPIKAPFVYNCIASDFEVIKEVIGGNLCGLEFDRKTYYFTAYYELLLKKDSGVVEQRSLDYFEAEWRRAISAEAGLDAAQIGLEATKEFAAGVNLEPGQNRSDLLKAHLRDYLYARFGGTSWLNRIYKVRYASVLEAAGFDER